MRLPLAPFVFAATISLSVVPVAKAETDKETKEALQKASDAAKRMNLKMPDVEKMLNEAEKEDATPAPSPKSSAAPKKDAAKSSSPLALPDWTPPVPQFKPDGPVSQKKVKGEEAIAQTGTSALTPAELGDAWEATKLDNTIARGRNNSNINDTKTVIMYLSTQDAPPREVRMEAKRAPGEKITHVTIYSPLPKATGSDD